MELKFTIPYGVYMTGDLANFPDPEAMRIIRMGVAGATNPVIHPRPMCSAQKGPHLIAWSGGHLAHMIAMKPNGKQFTCE